MTRADYRAMLEVQGKAWAAYTFFEDFRRFPNWALAELLDYLEWSPK